MVLGRSQDTLEPGDVLQIDPACPVFLPVNEFHDRVLRNSDQIDLIPGEKIQLLMEAGAGKGQERHVQKALQDHFLQIHTVFFCDLHMDPGIPVTEPLEYRRQQISAPEGADPQLDTAAGKLFDIPQLALGPVVLEEDLAGMV